MGHSTGGLTLTLWAARHPGLADALVLNSPWLELQLGPLGRQALAPLVDSAPGSIRGEPSQPSTSGSTRARRTRSARSRTATIARCGGPTGAFRRRPAGCPQ